LKQFDQYCLSLEGVVVKSLCEILIDIINSAGNIHYPVDYQTIYELTLDLALGKISEEEFLHSVFSLTGMRFETCNLKEMIVDNAPPILGIMDVLKELGEKKSLFMFSQYPPEMYDRIKTRLGLDKLIPEKNVFFTSGSGVQNLKSGIIERLIFNKWITPGKSIFIDNDSRRTSAAIRAGIDAIIFVDSRRLRREIALRGLLPKLGDE